MRPLAEAARDLALRGQTTQSQIVRVIGEDRS
jgi:hypothetical protein